MYNKVIMLGRVVNDLEIKTTSSGLSVLTFSIAVDRKFQPKGEERKVDFFNCVAWRDLADHIAHCWNKGKPILVEGELQNRDYTDKNGVKHYITEIIVDRVSFTGDSKSSGGGETAPPPGLPVLPGAPQMTVSDEDYPL